MVNELSVEALCKKVPPEAMGCRDSSQIDALKTIIGQERAVRALRFGLGIKKKGFNIFVAGMPGTGRITSVSAFLEETAGKEPVPFDWCYVNNFHDSYHPQALKLPAGRAVKFQGDMEKLTTAALREIRSAFDSDDYAAQRDGLIKSFEAQKAALLEGVSEQARQRGFAIRETPTGLVPAPVKDGKLLSEEEFMALSAEEQEKISKTIDELHESLETLIRQAKAVDKKISEAVQNLEQQVAGYALKHQFEDIKAEYQDLEEIGAYLDRVQNDMIENLGDFKPAEEAQPPAPQAFERAKNHTLTRYAVNVLVNNSERPHAPVVLELNPTYGNLFGKIEQEAEFGALVTHFALIRPGSIHKANGGYLVLPAEELVKHPLAWESLKRALENGQIVIEDASDSLGAISTKSLSPAPIPLNEKVILVGRPEVYNTLLAYDEQFDELFKVRADFETRMPRTPENIHDYAGFISKLCRREALKHLDCAAMARVIEYSSRVVEDQEKLSTHFGEIADVIREASYYASLEDAPLTQVAHIIRAIEERRYRSGLIQEQTTEMISRGVIRIDVDGEKCGQVNGLSIIEQGGVSFGQPSRITVSIGLGHDGLIDIEREADLGGPLHTKGVMILSGYLTEKFAQDKPLSLSARLVFEQSYYGIEGDSASSTELYAILSALSGLPVRQGVAVTGSVNQRGEVQAIGGVNEKIEGFFDVCAAKGLTGNQGVIIPQSNGANLMLKEALLDAVRAGKFHVWAAATIDEGIEILTGVNAGIRLETGGFEEGSVNARVDEHLKEMAETLESFGKAE